VVTEGIEPTKIKHTHSRDTWKNPFGTHNERQDCEIGTAGRVLVREERMSRGDEGERIWTSYAYMKPLGIALSGAGD
jgi:hypothetical protein